MLWPPQWYHNPLEEPQWLLQSWELKLYLQQFQHFCLEPTSANNKIIFLKWIHYGVTLNFRWLLRVNFTSSVMSESTGCSCCPVTSLPENWVVILIGWLSKASICIIMYVDHHARHGARIWLNGSIYIAMKMAQQTLQNLP